jgi:glycosyltransferase involved in cell wall biosynthesis
MPHAATGRPSATPARRRATFRSGRPRLGVVVTEIGIPSEIWAARQLEEMTRVEPALIAWRHAPAPVWGEGMETRLIPAPFAPERTLLRRVAGRLGRAEAVLPDAKARAAIRKTILDADLDAVLCHFAWNAIPVIAALDGAPGAPPVVVQVHGRDVSALTARADYRRALARTLPKLAGAVAVGQFQIGRLEALTEGPLPPHEVIPCGAPTALFAARPLPEREEGAPVRFVSVGRISPEKGMMESLAAFERVAAELPDAEWTCIGDGPLMDALRAAVGGRPAAARIRLPGRMAPDAVAGALAASHVFVQHSCAAGGWIEGFGVSLTEAGASGLPLVASDLGGIPDQLRDRVNGFLFPPGDVAAQAARMLELARDEPLRRRMGAAARDVAARFDSARMSARLEELLLGTMRGAAELRAAG